jgi:predicted dithiol-disulfide oxidoreductase (DUF899 family)
MPTHEITTQEEWNEARKRLREREEELGKLDEEIAKERQALPWVRVEKEYTLDAEDGKKTLPELFDGRSQLLIYQLMFGPTYEAACAGCTGLADHFDGMLPHLNARDVTLIAVSRAPIEKLRAYKQRMGWKFPYVSSYNSDFNFDFDGSLTEEQMADEEMAKMVAEADDWLKDWARDVGTDLEHGLAENPSWNVFKLEDGVVYRTYYRTAPDRFMLAPFYFQMLDQVPDGRDVDFPLRRHDEY